MKYKLAHYAIMIATILAGAGMYYAVTRDYIQTINPLDELGQVVQYLVIFDTIITVPLGLWINAKKHALWGMVLASNSMIPAIACAYWMGGYTSMLYLAGIAAIAWYFAKNENVDANVNANDNHNVNEN